jgi:hypothetical protein
MANSSGRVFQITRMQRIFALLSGTCFLLSSCGSSTKSVELAQRSAEQLHLQLDSEHFTALYAASDEKLHQAASETDFVKLLDAVHRKLGNVQQSSLRNTGVAWFAGQGATVTLVYETKFAQGTGVEKFLWHIKDNGAALYGYNINSNELITK